MLDPSQARKLLCHFAHPMRLRGRLFRAHLSLAAARAITSRITPFLSICVTTTQHAVHFICSKNRNEIYAGISWDDATRGKHDGSVIDRDTNQLVRHFKCGPTQGSFLRLNKVDLGCELTPQLMRSRYVEPDAELIAPDNVLPHVARTAGGRSKPIEFHGELKIRKRQQLEVVDAISLRMLGISRPCDGGSEELREFNHLKCIDLAGNLLSDWKDVVAITKSFPSLQSLSLASNRINDVNPNLMIGTSMECLTTLNLNSTNICSFQTLRLLGEAIPNLEELCVAHCDLSDIDAEASATMSFNNLELLDMSDCQLTSWGEHIMPLSRLPKLESFVLNDNPIESISFQETADGLDFVALASLQLAGTSIHSWKSVDELDKLPALRSLRLRNTPLTSSLGVGEVRSTTIARLPRLEYFNASPVPERERTEAERRYVSDVARELLLMSTADDGGADGKKRQVETRHPRFGALMEAHKSAMMASSSVTSLSQGIQDDVVGVTIRSMAAGSCDLEPLHKRIPRSLKVGRIKAMCSRAFALDVDLQILHFRVDGDPFPTELDDDEHTLAYFGVTDGAEILVNEIDVEAREREEARRREQHDRLVEEQESHIAVVQSMQRQERQILPGQSA